MVEKKVVRQVLAQYDLLFLPTFAENYGHSIAESLSVGTPVLMSDNAPWKNLQEKGLGWDIHLSDKASFIAAINEISAFSPEEDKIKLRYSIQSTAREILSDPIIIQDNIKLFNF